MGSGRTEKNTPTLRPLTISAGLKLAPKILLVRMAWVRIVTSAWTAARMK